MRRVLPLMLLLVACTGAAEDTTTTLLAEPSTTSTAPSTTTTTTEPTTTTTEATGPVDICPRSRPEWEVGVTHDAPCFLAPMSFTPAEQGWLSQGAGSAWMKIYWRATPSETEGEIQLGVVTTNHANSPAEVLAALPDYGITWTSTVPGETTVGGRPGRWVDVRGEPREGAEGDDCVFDSSLAGSDDDVIFHIEGAGNTLFSGRIDRGDAIGVFYCQDARIWAIDTGGPTITFVGGTKDPEQHAEAVAIIERLLETVEFLDP
jgi:hypothetical protein